jgi:hypothetical protein
MLMEKTVEIQLKEERLQVIKEIKAFAGDYSHQVDGRDVVIVEQLLDFLESREALND